MKNILSLEEINKFKEDGAVILRNKFDEIWIAKLRLGIRKAKNTPSPRLVSHTKEKDQPAYYEDFWSWNLFNEFEDFVFNSPTAKMAAELLGANKIYLVMDNWFFREAGSKSFPPFHHDISYFDFEGSMCVLWLPLEQVKKEEGISFVKGSHLWNKLFLRTRFYDGHRIDGDVCKINGKTYENAPNIIKDKTKYEFLHWDLALGDCIYFDIRTLHGSLNEVIPKKNIHRYTLRMVDENGKIEYRGKWAKQERDLMKQQGYNNGDKISGKMFPQLWSK